MNNKKNKNKHKLSKINLILGLILLVVVFLIILLFSYAHFKVNTNNNATASTVQTDFACLDVSFNQTGAINLNKNYPVTDAYALANFTPITATITNNCSSEQVNYVLSLSSIYLKADNYDTSYIPDSKIRVKALKQVGTNTESTLKDTRYLSELSTLDSTSKSYKYISSFYNTDSNFTNYSLKNTYQVDSSTIEANSTVTYKIYLWIDYYEGAPGRTSNEEYNNSTQGLKFKVSSAVTLNIKEDYKFDSLSTLAQNLVNSGWLWQSNLEGDGYRYIGSGNATASTSPKNFICFGTADKDTCTANPSTYMYRIIGVFADENGDNHVKLIKYTQLGAYAWNDDDETDIDWANSDLYKGLNGSYFLTNKTYSYMQDNTWLSKITNWKWTAVNTLTSGEDTDYFYRSPSQIYLHEMNRSTKPSTIGEWTTPTAKIGLMSMSDYALSLGSTALAMTYSTNVNRSTLKTGWLHQSNNDTTASTDEWTISRYGSIDGDLGAWFVAADGYASYTYVNNGSGSRAVFYLESDIEGEGIGSITDPYILQ